MAHRRRRRRRLSGFGRYHRRRGRCPPGYHLKKRGRNKGRKCVRSK